MVCEDTAVEAESIPRPELVGNRGIAEISLLQACSNYMQKCDL